MNSPAAKPGFMSSLAVYGERRIAVMLALGFAAGLPNLLIFDTLSAWLRQSDLSLQTISFFSLATLVYSFKFLWAPLIDRTSVPFFTALLGHRRSWMLVAQVAIMVGLFLISASDPKSNLMLVAAFAVFTGFSSATQDIVVDAWRIEAADTDRQGAMAAAYQWGYRAAIVVAGAVPLILAETYGWNISYGLMAVLMLIGMAAVFLAPKENSRTIREIPTAGTPHRPAWELLEWLGRLFVLTVSALLIGSGLSGNLKLLQTILLSLGQSSFADGLKVASASSFAVLLQLVLVLVGFALVGLAASPFPTIKTRPGIYLSHALRDPLADFFRRFGASAGLILALICFYRLSDFVLNIMTPYYLDVGYTQIQIAEVRKIFGLVASMSGVFLGGWSIIRFGLMPSLAVGAFAVPLANILFIVVALVGPDMPTLFCVIGLDNIASGFAGTCLIAFMSSLTSKGFTATQYALFSSLYSLPGKLIASQSGAIVEGAAHASEQGHPLAFLQGLFAHSSGFATAMEKSHVAPAALGSGYVTFFLYSALIGVISVTLSLMLLVRRKREQQSVSAA